MGFMDFINKLTNGSKSEPFDPSIFKDPLALQTQWTPKSRGGANFKTRTLKQVSPKELHYVGSSFGKVFAGIFLLFPLVFIIIGATSLYNEGLNFVSIWFLIFPLIFIVVGYFVFKKMNTVSVLDKTSGFFSKGRNGHLSSLNPVENEHIFKLSSIKALQFLPERVRSKNSTYTSYEINFIFEDGSRYNLVDHGHRKSIEADAYVISNFLKIPLWDKISKRSYVPKNNSTSSSYNSLDPKKSTPHIISPSFSRSDSNNTSVKNSESQDLDKPYDSSKPREM